MEGKTKDYYGDYAVTEVPMAKRRSFRSMFLIVAGICCCVPALYAGQAIAGGLALGPALLAVFIGFGITGVLGGFCAVIGERHGIGTVMIGRQIFGRMGTGILAIMMLITGVGWFAMNTGFFGQVINALYPGHFLTDPVVAAIWGGLLMMITAAIGFRAIAFLSFLVVPLFIVVVLACLVALTSEIGFAALFSIMPVGQFTLTAGITMMAGGMAMGAVIAPDITRYAKRDRDAFWSWCIGIWIVDLIIVGVGAALTIGTGGANLPVAMLAIGVGVGALMILILGQWTTNDNNLYSTALACMNLIPMKKWQLTVIFGIIGTALAAAGIVGQFVAFLMLLGTYVPAIGGIMLADYFIVRKYIYGISDKKRYEFGEGAKYKAVNVPAVVCFIVGGYLGSITPGIIVVNSVLISMALYILWVYISKKSNIPYQFGEIKEGKKGF